MLPVLHAGQELTFGCAIALQFVGDDHAWHRAEAFKELPKKTFCSLFVPSVLHKDISHIAILIHSPPERMCFPVDLQVHFIQMPCVVTARVATTQCIGVGLPKLQTSLSNCFIRNDDPALRQQFLDIAKTEREAEIQPNSMTDNFWWKAIAFVTRSNRVCFHDAILTYGSAIFAKLTLPIKALSLMRSTWKDQIWVFLFPGYLSSQKHKPRFLDGHRYLSPPLFHYQHA